MPHSNGALFPEDLAVLIASAVMALMVMRFKPHKEEVATEDYRKLTQNQCLAAAAGLLASAVIAPGYGAAAAG